MKNDHLDSSLYRPRLAFLRQAISPWVSGFENALIKTGANPTSVHRLALSYAPGASGLSTAMLKVSAPLWPDDPYGPDRERLFYERLWPHIWPQAFRVYHVGVDPDTKHRVVVMEDLTAAYRFPAPAHIWSEGEMRCMLRAYARFHTRGRNCLPPRSERAWMWRMALHRREWAADELMALYEDLVRWGIWSPLPGIELLIEETLAALRHLEEKPATVLHNDVYPPNVGLPLDLERDAILLDWEMVGWGLAELDLAFMFLQPYRSARNINRADALEYYWDQRLALEGHRPPFEERRIVQHHADALWALSLVPVAHQVVTRPFPVGSVPEAYWISMHGVLYEKLRDLRAET